MKNSIVEVLKIDNFVKIWSSQILSQVTINLINFVIVLRIFEATHSTVAVSLVWIFYAIPALLLGPFSGTIVDLTEKRKILMLTTFVETAVVLLYLLVKAKLWPIYSVIFLYSLVNQLYIPAEASTLTSVVPKKLFPIANSFFLFTIYGAFLAGFGSAGSLVRIVGRNTPFFLAALFLGLAFLAVSLLPRGLTGEKKKINGLPDFFKKVNEGYRFIQKDTTVLFPLLLLALANVLISVFAVLAPLIATEMLSIELLDIGLVIVLPIGLGTILGALWVILALRRLRKKKVISLGLFLLTIGLLSFSLLLPRIEFGRILIAMLIIFLMGAALVAIYIPAQTLMQEKTPIKFRGRVFGVLSFLFTLTAILPVLLTATIADTLGLTWVIFLMAMGLGALAIYSLGEPYARQISTNYRS